MPEGWVYILKGINNNRYYVGSTSNLKNRIKKHNTGQVLSTKRIGKVKLVFSQEFQSISKAKKIEYWIKHYKKRELIDKIIQERKINKAF